ncbi:MAG: hypothetical protein HN572_10990 [Kordiimonadaceae bacterium]|nr:hypothetical protein [Kordiimonadaceae bacterium]
MSIMRLISGFIVVLLLSSCGPGRYDSAYRPSMSRVDQSNAYLLDAGAQPRLIFTDDFERDLEIFTDQNFSVVGESRFMGLEEDPEDAMKMGEKLGVTHILLLSEFAYNGTKKAYRYIENYDYVREVKYYNGQPYYGYQSVANPISVPYRKNVTILRQRAAYLVKMK